MTFRCSPFFLTLICVYIVYSICCSTLVAAVTFYRNDPLTLAGIDRLLHDPVLRKDLGNYVKKELQSIKTVPQKIPETWTGKWFPESSTMASDTRAPESWTGRWFPEETTTPPITRHQQQQFAETSVPSPYLSNTTRAQEISLPSVVPKIVITSPLGGSSQQLFPQLSNDSLRQSLLSPLFSLAPVSFTSRRLPETQTTATIQQSDQLPQITASQLISPELNNNYLMSRSEESWTGKWFPERVTSRPRPQLPTYEATPFPNPNSMWNMINSSCDDGKTNLTVDWDGSPVNYTCFNPHNYFEPDYVLPNLIIKSNIPKAYKAKHECMNRQIEYLTDLPTYGTHRPAWPRYGQYKFLPRQRWLHSLEHGAVVMLYHPCAHPQLVKELKEIITSCLYRHVITPYTLLPPDRPLALLTWGWALLMTSPDKHGVTRFIREHALHGPEAMSKDGQFSEGLIHPATVITDLDDTTDISLCPQTLF